MTGLEAAIILAAIGFVGFCAIAAPALLIGEGQRSQEEEERIRRESA